MSADLFCVRRVLFGYTLLAYELETTVRQPRHEDAAFIDVQRGGIFLLREIRRAGVCQCIRIANHAVAISDATHILTRFAVRWNLLAILHHSAFSGIVTGQCEPYVA